ncbi:hypothetical protein ACFX11_024808 [Malus domestica]
MTAWRRVPGLGLTGSFAAAASKGGLGIVAAQDTALSNLADCSTPNRCHEDGDGGSIRQSIHLWASSPDYQMNGCYSVLCLL